MKKQEKKDMIIRCVEEACGHQEFFFKVGEQEFYESQGLFPPKRCPMCRQRRKFATMERNYDNK